MNQSTAPKEPQPFQFANLLASSKQVEDKAMTISNLSEAAKAVVRRNTEEVQGGGNFEVFEQLFADDFLDHTPQPGRLTRTVRDNSTKSSGPRSPTFTPTFIGRLPMVTA